MEKKKFFNKVCVISYIGIGVCFVGFVLGGMASVGGKEPIWVAILLPFFGFGIFAFIGSYAYRNSEFRDKHLKSVGESLGFRDEAPKVVVKCRYCGHLNEEEANYCNSCGEKI